MSRYLLDLRDEPPSKEGLDAQSLVLLELGRAVAAIGAPLGVDPREVLSPWVDTTIACVQAAPPRRCSGYVRLRRMAASGVIEWACGECSTDGIVVGWERGPWDTRPGFTGLEVTTLRQLSEARRHKGAITLRVSLDETKPEIWRTIVVPRRFTFWELHCAISDAMGWQDSHLHLFTVEGPRKGTERTIGIPGDDDPTDVEADWEVPIWPFLSRVGARAAYLYDFGDSWQHTLEVVEFAESAPKKLPRCIDGARACPPEDCGGVHGFQEILRSLKRGRVDAGLRVWLGDFEPERFSPEKVKFTRPQTRLDDLLGDD